MRQVNCAEQQKGSKDPGLASQSLLHQDFAACNWTGEGKWFSQYVYHGIVQQQSLDDVRGTGWPGWEGLSGQDRGIRSPLLKRTNLVIKFRAQTSLDG